MLIWTKHVWIPYNTPSLKNSRIPITIKGGPRKGQAAFVESETCRKYRQNTKNYWLTCKNTFIGMAAPYKKPLIVGMYFIRDSKRIFDHINACQIVQDLMVDFAWIEDDNVTQLIPVFFGYHVEPSSPGVAIFIIEQEDYITLRDKYIVVQPKQIALEL